MEILHLLETVLGPSNKSSSDEHLFSCPFCHHHKKKLSINLGSKMGYWKCWVCNRRGKRLYSLLHKISAPAEIIKQILKLSNETYYHDDEELKEVDLHLPIEYIPLYKTPPQEYRYEWKNAMHFAKKRGITYADVFKHDIGFAPDGEYKGRLIIPSYDKNFRLNYFVARSYFDGGIGYKYKNPPVSKDVVIFENMINWSMPIILVEGMLDAIALRRNAIPLNGKTLQPSLELAIIKNSPPEVYVMLDADASSAAIDIADRLSSFEIETMLVFLPKSLKDPSDMGFETSWKMLQDHSAEITFCDLVTQRLNSI